MMGKQHYGREIVQQFSSIFTFRLVATMLRSSGNRIRIVMHLSENKSGSLSHGEKPNLSEREVSFQTRAAAGCLVVVPCALA